VGLIGLAVSAGSTTGPIVGLYSVCRQCYTKYHYLPFTFLYKTIGFNVICATAQIGSLRSLFSL